MSTPLPESPPPPQHRRERTSSSVSEFTFFELEHKDDQIVAKETDGLDMEQQPLPEGNLLVVTETDKAHSEHAPLDHNNNNANNNILVSSLSEFHFDENDKFHVKMWDGTLFYSDFIQLGLLYQQQDKTNNATTNKVVMLYESPSTSSADASFHNKDKYKFHDWPPLKSTLSKGVLGPCRYSLMNGKAFPAFLRQGKPPAGLEEHWQHAVPGYVPGTYVDKIQPDHVVYAYLPVEQIQHHVNDPQTHYHLAGKDAIHLMTTKTTKILPDTRTSRPCVVKTTHSMGSKGIFIIQNDQDEQEFEQFLEESGNPTFVITDFVDIARNVACHFFMHPDGSIVWFGSNENHREPDGKFSSDSYLLMEHQETLQKLQLPFVEEVVNYCKGLGFWGFCGVDVLFDSHDNGYLVDINPRVTGSCPALMALKLLSDKYDFQVGLFRRSGGIFYKGSAETLLASVKEFNEQNEGKMRVVLHAIYDDGTGYTKSNIGVYGNSLGECKEVLNTYAKSKKDWANDAHQN